MAIKSPISVTRMIPACLVLVALIVPQPAEAWGNTGHEAVAYVAWQLMGPTARSQALTLIQMVPQLTSPKGTKVDGFAQWVTELPAGLSADQKNLFLFMRASTWADAIKHVGFQDSDNPPPNDAVDKPSGFSDLASHGYWHFVDMGLTADSSTVLPTPTPNAAVQIVELRKDLASGDAAPLKAYELVWLEHLVGDIHQPLHGATRFVAGKSDIGGNDVTITLPKDLKAKFEASLPAGARTNDPRDLHAFWDDLPGEPNAIQALGPATDFAKSLTAASGAAVQVTDPAAWALESFNLAKSDAYRRPIGPGNKTASGKPYMMTDAYYTTALADAKSQIALAGARLAKLLDDTWPEAKNNPGTKRSN
jgi:S1/P1 Nuclease